MGVYQALLKKDDGKLVWSYYVVRQGENPFDKAVLFFAYPVVRVEEKKY